jgi:uncharacterized hydrophobic protein (TIGR00271 family)
MRLRVVCAGEDRSAVLGLLDAEPGVAHVLVARGVSREPEGGDLIEATIAREVAQEVVQRLVDRGIGQRGEIDLARIELAVSETARAAEHAAPGSGDEAIIWDELVETTGEESRLNPTFLLFLTIACLLAAIGVVADSPITIVGAMVVSPDFGPLAAIAVGLVGRRRHLAAQGAVALGIGYPVAILVTLLVAVLAAVTGLYEPSSITAPDNLDFVYRVGPASFALAVLAGVAGIMALTSDKSGPLIGVFISVTTVPAAGFAALAAVAGDWVDFGQSILQLLVFLTGISLSGAVTLWVRRRHVMRRSSRSST